MHRAAARLHGAEEPHELLVGEETPVGDRGVDAHEIGGDRAAGAEVHVADLAVAHLSRGESYSEPRRLEQRARMARRERVPVRRSRERDGVPFALFAMAPAVEHDEDHRALALLRHLCSVRVKDYVPARHAPRAKCIPLLTPLPAMRTERLALLALLMPAALLAQTPAVGTVTAPVSLRVAPDGKEIAALRVNSAVQLLGTSGSWTHVTVEGWLHVSVIGPAKDSFPLSAKSSMGAIMRAAADRTAPVVAQLEDGMGLQLIARTEQWSHVKRSGWVLSSTVRAGAPKPVPAAAAVGVKPPAAPAAAPASPPAVAAPVPVATAESLPGDVAVARRTTIHAAPTGAVLGTLDSATRLVTGPSERGWVHVTMEGWVKQADVIPLDSVPISTISAADLRADPDRYKGQTVRWVVEVIAYQTADPLRKGLRIEEPYLLARGPGSESSLLYLALPPSLMDMGRELKPLSSVVILAKVRYGRSDPSGVPVLDVQRIIQR